MSGLYFNMAVGFVSFWQLNLREFINSGKLWKFRINLKKFIMLYVNAVTKNLIGMLSPHFIKKIENFMPLCTITLSFSN